MADDTQMTLFDAESARQYQRQQHDAEREALLMKIIGTKATKQWQQKLAKEQAELDAILKKPLTPRLQTARDRIFAQALAATDPAKNPYTLLGIAPDATKRDIKNAYRRKARKLHPDAGGDDEAFKQLYSAYRKALAAAKS
jgi:hypothetical protein